MTQEYRDETLFFFRELYPTLDPQGIYCLFTGAKIGLIDRDEVDFVLDSLDGEPEVRAEELMTRVLGASRPGIRWNKIRVMDIGQMRERAPIETLAYLRNGATGLRKDGTDFIAEMTRRIESFFELLCCTTEELDSRWYDFYRAKEDALAETQRAARMMRHWLSNVDPIGLKARHDSVIAKLHQEAEDIRSGKKKGRIKIVSERTAKEKERDAKISMASAFFDSIMDGTAEPAAPVVKTQPANSPLTPRVGFRIRLTQGA